MEKKIEKIKELFKRLKSTDRGRALLFFLGYFVFFIFVYIFIATSGRINTTVEDYETGDMVSFNVDNIINKNYSYKYIVTLDVNDYTYTGKRNNNYELLEYDNNNYFINHKGNDIYKKDNNEWINSNNPNDFSYFTDIDNIMKLANNSTYISKTDYESGKKTYTYEISTTTLEKIINNIDIDLDDKPNELVFSTDEDENVDSIKMKLDSYGKYKGNCKKYFTIEINYDQFGLIDNIENPIKE